MTVTTSLAVWDVPIPAVAGDRFAVKIGATASAGQTVEVCDDAGRVIATGTLGRAPLAGTQALFWTSLELPAPATVGIAEYTVRIAGRQAAAHFSVAAAPRPEHTLSVAITERDSKTALDGVEIRLGPFHGRTDRAGRADIRIAPGDYRLQLWRTAHIAEPQTVSVGGDMELQLTMTHVPEEHPDARWVR